MKIRSDLEEEEKYQEDCWREALKPFEYVCKYESERICQSVASSYLNEDLISIKLWHDLGLTRKHALIACDNIKEFWIEHQEEAQNNR